MPLRAGVDLGGTKIQAVVTDDQHAVLGQARHPTPKEDGPQGVADGIVAAIREALEGAGAEAGRLEGIGIGSPGAADDEAGTVTQARNVTPDWTGSFPLASAVGGRWAVCACGWATMWTWPPWRRPGWARGADTPRCWACSGAPASAAASSSTTSPGRDAVLPASSAIRS